MNPRPKLPAAPRESDLDPGQSTQGNDDAAQPTLPPGSTARAAPGNVDATLAADPGPTLDPAQTTAGLSGTVPSSPARSVRGTHYGNYELLEEIARGGMGVVYRARHVKLNRVVALKMILAGQFASPAAVQRFYAEAQAAAQLEHPGIVPIYEIGEWGGQHFFAMAFVEGQSLQARVRKGPLAPREAAGLIRDIATAMHYAHEKGVVHRDLKPHNILLDAAGHPKVTDFGLAKRMEDAEGLTASGDILGTPSYMAPEQAAGRVHELGPSVDVYALGAILYTLLTGRPPFQAAALSDTLRQVIEQEPVPPRLLNSSTPKDLETVCLKCLDKHAARRYVSAQALADDLQRLLDGEPIQARRTSSVYRAWRWCRRRPLAAALIAVVLLLGLSLGIAGALSLRAARASRVAALTRLFESQLNQPELTAAYIQQQDALLGELAALDPAQAADDRQRLDARLAEQVQLLLDTPRIDEALQAKIVAAIALIEPRQPQRAAALQVELRKRMGEWQPAWSLRKPFENLQQLVADENRFESSPGGLLRTVYDRPLVLFERPSTSASEIAVTFAPAWEESSDLGVMLHADKGSGYQLLLHTDDSAVVSDRSMTSKPAAGATPPATFRQLRSTGQRAQLTIRRHGVVLQRREWDLANVPPGNLQLRLRRERDNLIAQVNSEPEVRAFDPFPAMGQTGFYAVHWPGNVPLVAVAAQEKELPPLVTPLETADSRFEARRYAEALPLYAAEASRSGSQFRQEAAYKQAVCLLALNRPEEAAAILDPLRLEIGPRWPALAGCRHWLALVRQGHTDEADAAFELLRARFSPEELSLLISDDVRDELIDRYIGEFDQPSRLLSYDPNRHANVERAVEVARYLVAENRGFEYFNRMLARAHEFDGNFAESARLYRWYLTAPGNSAVQGRHYFRLLRVMDQSQQALAEANALLKDLPANPPTLAYGMYTLERARTRLALQEPDSAVDADLAAVRIAILKALSDPKPSPDWNYVLAELSLLEGFRLIDRGQAEAAEALWKSDFELVRPALVKPAGYTDLQLKGVILGSLAGQLSEAEAQGFLGIFLGGESDSPLLAALRNATSGEATTLTAAIRSAWRTPRGHEIARLFALESMPKRQMLQLPMQLLFVEFMRDNAFRGTWSSEQEQMMWDSGGLFLAALIDDGTVSFDQLLPMALAWKGFGAVGAWVASKDRYPPELQPRVAYILAHRQIQRKVPQKTAETFFKAAGELAPEGSALRRLAAEDLALLNAGQGQLLIVGSVKEPVTLLLTPAEGEPVAWEVRQPGQTLDLSPGAYTAAISEQAAGNGVKLPGGKFSIGIAQHVELRLE